MKRDELQKCCICREGVMKDRQITFSRVTVERFLVDVGAVQRAHGLEMVLGGNGFLANAMGPNEDLAKRFHENEVFVCDSCGIEQLTILELSEREPQKV